MSEKSGTGRLSFEAPSDSDEVAFEKFTRGTPAETTDGKEVMSLSDSYVPRGAAAQQAARAYFTPKQQPLADYLTSAGDKEQFHHKIFETRQPGVYYREVELLKSGGSITQGVSSYSRPWDESSFLSDLQERTQKK